MKPIKFTIATASLALLFGLAAAGCSESHHDPFCIVFGVASAIMVIFSFISLGAFMDDE